MRLLSISTDRQLFDAGSAVWVRCAEHARGVGESHLLVFADRRFTKQQIARNCRVYPTRSRTRWLYLFDAIRLGRSIIKGNKITEITCQDPFLTAVVALSLKKRFNIPVEIQVHTDIGSPHFGYTKGNKVRKILARWSLPKADKIRVVSDRLKTYLVEVLKVESSKIEVRPIVVGAEEIKGMPVAADLHKKYPQFSKIVLMASRLTREKNIRLAIEAMWGVVKGKPQAGLIIVGSGPERGKLEERSARLGLKKNVIFEPWANRETLISYYKTADLFLVTSLYEGYGMTLVEARAAGCDIVSTDVGVAPEMNIRLVEHNVGSMAEGIIESLQ
ncbi:MAG: glycosyltransferase family 4 protein [Patescibacteria group bacterium]|nr:glycosyltransferase family 4 protein [Patescibacteria group bacterium]